MKPGMTTCSICSANLEIYLKGSDFISCASCGTSFKKKDYALEKSDMFYSQPETMSPLSIGTEGRVDGKDFIITGKHTFRFDSFVCNLWQIVFEDLNTAFISDCVGEYALVYNENISASHFRNQRFKAGNMVQLSEINRFYVDGLFLLRADYPEGELIKYIEADNESVFIFLSKTEDFVAIVFYARTKDPVLFKGQILDFKNFEFKLLRDVAGW